MKAAKILGLTVLVLLSLCGAFFLIPIFVLQIHLSGACQEIAAIARDEQAVAYLDNWVSKNILNQGYTFVFGMHGRVWVREADQYVNITQLPEESISRIPNEYLRLEIETVSDNRDQPITSTNVGQIAIGYGRNQIILLKNGKSLLSYRGDDEGSGHLLRINEAVYVYCADARF
ncbi:hypothetical protein [Zooshikella ganghwensis]|uniref:Uncharacterized protein n=1 Tax=Zooshikella ganghwensis TaxID=202772 RepID=A0A4P9VUE8_9GAMM|nr:hypothetical protein [Zooshikella ganghwensis]RDH46357.1 hypothetical protein B9G39_24495 [Zooshikella ganghwensis]